MYADVCRCMQMYADVCNCLSSSVDVSCPSVFTKSAWYVLGEEALQAAIELAYLRMSVQGSTHGKQT